MEKVDTPNMNFIASKGTKACVARYMAQCLFSLCLNHTKTVCVAYFSDNRDMSTYEF